MLSKIREEHPQTYQAVKEIVAAATGQPVEAIGDGTILKWLVANGPALLAFGLQLLSVFGLKIPTPPAPSPSTTV